MKNPKIVLNKKTSPNTSDEVLLVSYDEMVESRKQLHLAKAQKQKQKLLEQEKQKNRPFKLAKKYLQLVGKVTKDPVKKYHFKQNPLSISCETQEEVEELLAEQKEKEGLKNRSFNKVGDWSDPLKAAQNLGIRVK